jgi:hypothetical protein
MVALQYQAALRNQVEAHLVDGQGIPPDRSRVSKRKSISWNLRHARYFQQFRIFLALCSEYRWRLQCASYQTSLSVSRSQHQRQYSSGAGAVVVRTRPVRRLRNGPHKHLGKIQVLLLNSSAQQISIARLRSDFTHLTIPVLAAMLAHQVLLACHFLCLPANGASHEDRAAL